MSSDLDVKGQSIGRAIQRYQASVHDFDQETARLLGVNATDLRCLEILITDVDEEVTPRGIADRLGITTGSVTTMLDRLEKVGYITRTRHGSDRRKVVVEATPAVRERVWWMISPLLDDSNKEVIAQFSTEQLDVVEQFMVRATELQQRHVERLREAG